jgi:hypothetical protein
VKRPVEEICELIEILNGTCISKCSTSNLVNWSILKEYILKPVSLTVI